MTLHQLIEILGYPGVFAGTLFEGEAALVAGGVMAQRGYLDLGWVLAIATLGAFLGDQAFFWIGRTQGRAWLAKRPRMHERAHRITGALRRAEVAVMLGFRFVIGTRIVTPVALGATGFPGWRFAGWNVLGSMIWAVTIGLAGYFFGHAIEGVLRTAGVYELWALGVIGAAGLSVALWLWVRRRRRVVSASGLSAGV